MDRGRHVGEEGDIQARACFFGGCVLYAVCWWSNGGEKVEEILVVEQNQPACISASLKKCRSEYTTYSKVLLLLLQYYPSPAQHGMDSNCSSRFLPWTMRKTATLEKTTSTHQVPRADWLSPNYTGYPVAKKLYSRDHSEQQFPGAC